MSYNWIYQADKQVNNNDPINGKTQYNTAGQNSKTRTKKHFPEINAKEKFQDVDSPLNIPLIRTRRSNGDSDSDSDQIHKNAELFSIMRKKPTKADDPQWEENRIEVLDKALKDGADINAIDKNWYDRTILHIAVKKKYEKIVNFLVENGAKNIPDNKGENPLDLAKKLGFTNIVTMLEKEEVFDPAFLRRINEIDEDGNTPLLKELSTEGFKSNIDFINDVIQAVADVNYQNPKTSMRAVDLAWQDKNYDIVLALLKADSYFPQGFNLDNLYEDQDVLNELKELVKEREKLHELIKGDKSKEISSFIKNRVSKFFNSQNKSAQEIAAAHANIDTLRATMGQGDKKAQQKLLSQINSEGDSLLLIATKNGKKDNIDFLIRYEVDVNYRNPKTNMRAVDLVLQDKNYDTVLALLKADSYLPQGFNLESLNENDSSQKQLKDFLQARNDFHELIKEKKLEELKDFTLKDKSQLYLNSQGQSALLTAVKSKKYEIYAFLRSIGVGCLGKEMPEIIDIKNKLSYQEKEILRGEVIRFLFPIKKSHILYLISKSKSHQYIENFQEKVGKFYSQLDAIPEISQILKVIECIDYLEIVFDFNGSNIEEVCPYSKLTTRGVTIGGEGRIYIAANREESLVLGTLAHELTHLAMQIIYENYGNPYKSNTDKVQIFKTITKGILGREDVQYVIKNKPEVDINNPLFIITKAFTQYTAINYDKELIVRIPHILAQYRSIGKTFLENYNELTSYYKDYVEKDYNHYIDNALFIKPRSTIRSLNQIGLQLRNFCCDAK